MAIKVPKIPKEGYKLIPESEKEDPRPFTVWVKPIGSKALLDLEDNLVQRKDGDALVYAQNIFEYKVVQLGLMAWDNVFDESNKKVELQFNADGSVSEDSLSPLPQNIIRELATIIATITRDPSTISLFFPDKKSAPAK